MRLVEQHTIKPSSVYYNELYDLLHKCKNLYNKGLYVVRQHYFQYKDDNTVKYKYLNYYSLEKKLKTEADPAKEREKGVRAGAEAVRKSAWDAFRAQCPHIAFPYGKEFPMCDDHE